MIARSAVWWLALVAWMVAPAQDSAPGVEPFSMRVVASRLASPWEILWGPDGRIWITERAGQRVLRVNPADGHVTRALYLPGLLQRHSQDGLLSMAFDPAFLRKANRDFVYLTMTYDADEGPAVAGRMRLRRYTYNSRTETLGSPLDLLSDLPAGDDHVSGRLVFGRDGKLYLTLGDGGFNQRSLFCEPIRAQELPSGADVPARNWQRYAGKILRINPDGSIPDDNPLFGAVRSHVYTVGHRNAQGLVVGRDGKVYASEHGPSVDDELNLVQAGKNYGWPYVAGYKDDQAYEYTNWSASSPAPCSTLTFTERVAPASVPHQNESAFTDPDFMAPLRTFFTVPNDFDFTRQNFVTIAPSGIDIYTSTAIPGWANSILVTSLTRGTVYRIKLNGAGDAAVGQTLEYFKSHNRYRDVLVGPDGRTIYAITDAWGEGAEQPGSLLAFTWRRE